MQKLKDLLYDLTIFPVIPWIITDVCLPEISQESRFTLWVVFAIIAIIVAELLDINVKKK